MRSSEHDGERGIWECFRCSQLVKEADRQLIDVELESEISASDYDFSSDMDMDTADLSGSIGTFSESMLSSNQD